MVHVCLNCGCVNLWAIVKRKKRYCVGCGRPVNDLMIGPNPSRYSPKATPVEEQQTRRILLKQMMVGWNDDDWLVR